MATEKEAVIPAKTKASRTNESALFNDIPESKEHSQLSRTLSKMWPSIVLFIALFVLWELIVVVFDVSSFVIAKPSEFILEMWTSRALLLEGTWVTLQEILIGFLISIIVGVVVAIFIVRFE